MQSLSMTVLVMKIDEPVKLDYNFEAELYVDGKLVSSSNLPTSFIKRKNTLFWKYQLPKGKHNAKIVILNPIDEIDVFIYDIKIYSDERKNPKY